MIKKSKTKDSQPKSRRVTREKKKEVVRTSSDNSVHVALEADGGRVLHHTLQDKFLRVSIEDTEAVAIGRVGEGEGEAKEEST